MTGRVVKEVREDGITGLSVGLAYYVIFFHWVILVGTYIGRIKDRATPWAMALGEVVALTGRAACRAGKGGALLLLACVVRVLRFIAPKRVAGFTRKVVRVVRQEGAARLSIGMAYYVIFSLLFSRWRTQAGTRIDQTKERAEVKSIARNRTASLIWRSIKKMRDDHGTHLAASVAYYAIFSLFPLIVGLLSLAGIFLASAKMEELLLSYLTDNFPGSKVFITANVEEVVGIPAPLGTGAFLALLWTTSGLFGAIDMALNQVWSVPRGRPFHMAKIRQLGVASAVGVLFLLSGTTTAAIEILVEPAWDLGGVALVLRLVPWGVSFSMFLLLYRFVPDCETYWRYVWPGAALAAALFEIGKGLFVWYLENIARFTQIYGSVESMMVLLTWIYVSSLILIFGAEVSSEYSRSRSGEHDGPFSDDTGADHSAVPGDRPAR